MNKPHCFECKKPATHTVNVRVTTFAACADHIEDLKTKLGPKAPAPQAVP